MLSPEFYSANRQRLCERVRGIDIIVVAGNGLMQLAGDVSYPFHQDANMMYLSGMVWPECTLATDVSTQKSLLLVPDRDDVSVAFNGPIDVDALLASSGVDDVLVGRQADAFLRRAIKGRRVGVLRPPRAYVGEMYTNPFRVRMWRRLQRLQAAELKDIRADLIALRSIKQPAEIRAIDTAARLTIGACAAVETQMEHIEHEYQAAAVIAEYFLRNGTHHAFPPIVAAGRNTCALHYETNTAPRRRHDLLLLDIGARVSGYSADIARTYLPQKSTARQRAIHEAVLAAQTECIAYLKPGMSWREFVTASDTIVGKHLVRLKLIDDATDRQQVRRFFPQSVSHSLGLDTHDPVDYSSTIDVGMVITVEPGIYLPDEAVGVRIEDDVLITEQGATVLGR